MRLLSKGEINGKTVLAVEFSYFFGYFTKIRNYEAQREFPKGYWDWLELPNRTMLNGEVSSFQLDAWNRLEQP